MSFSSEVKEELSKTATLANKDAVKAELIGYIITGNVTLNGKSVNFSTESEYNINRFSKLLNNLNIMNYSIGIQGKIYTISAKTTDVKKNFSAVDDTTSLNSFLEDILKQEVLKKALVRGAFLGGGSINNPKNTYHLEITFSSGENANIVLAILNKYEIQFKNIEKKNGYALYTKDGDEISKFLALIGANSSVLKFEEVRVYRDIRNNVNRKVNCETANLNKTLNAALKQIENIKYLKQIGQFDKMPEQLQEIANLRLENPEASLVEIGQMLSKPIGKSGVNHRFYNIEQFVSKFRQ